MLFAKKNFILLLAVLAVLSVSACLRVAADDLYSLPEASEVHIRLQEQLNSILSQGAEFSPPTGGPNKSAVQRMDLNGNGLDEVLAFFSVNGESTLKVCIFEMVDGEYVVADAIEGSGTAIESVRYADMDGDGVMEIIIGWQMSPTLQYFSVYSIRDFHNVQLVSEEYTELAVFDLHGNGNESVVALRLQATDIGSSAQVFTLMPDGEIVREEARLSTGIEAITRVLTGMLTDGVPAIFVDSEGSYDEGNLVTDICAFYEGIFTNVTLRAPGGISEETIRTRLNSSDINKDNVVEVTIPRLLIAQSETPYYVIDWYAFSSAGEAQLAMTTYHNTFDEWYLILPLDWRGSVSVRREDLVAGERTVIFSHIVSEEGPYEDFLKVYKLSGGIGEERANLPGRIWLMSEGTSTYAFELLAPPNSFGLSFDGALIRANFRLIYSEWLAGTY